MPKPRTGRRSPLKDADRQERPSRSEKKRESLAMQKLGEELASLTQAERGELNLPAELTEALKQLDSLRDREAQRRQRQFIGKIMRGVDAGAIAASLATRRNQRIQRSEWLVIAKNYTNLLLHAPEKNLNHILKRFLGLTLPGMLGESQVDARRHLRELARKARGQRQTTPEETAKASKELFDALAAILPV